jgi:hypothetical protein
VSARRCPSCGGLVGEEAEWCGQCLAPLERARTGGPAPRSSAPGGVPGAPIRVEGDRASWACPACGTQNPLEANACSSCGTPFSHLFERPGQGGPTVAPHRAAALSLLFPGIGHAAAGRVAEGVARGVVFLYTLGTGLAILLLGGGSGILLPITAMSLAASAGLYALSAMDARRVAAGEPQLLSTRMLLYAGVGMMLLTLVVLAIGGFGVAGR